MICRMRELRPKDVLGGGEHRRQAWSVKRLAEVARFADAATGESQSPR